MAKPFEDWAIKLVFNDEKETDMSDNCKPQPIHRNETVQIEHESLDVATIAYQDAFLDAKYNYIRQAERKQATARDLRRLAGLEDARAADIYAQINAGFPVADDGPAAPDGGRLRVTRS